MPIPKGQVDLRFMFLFVPRVICPINKSQKSVWEGSHKFIHLCFQKLITTIIRGKIDWSKKSLTKIPSKRILNFRPICIPSLIQRKYHKVTHVELVTLVMGPCLSEECSLATTSEVIAQSARIQTIVRSMTSDCYAVVLASDKSHFMTSSIEL